MQEPQSFLPLTPAVFYILLALTGEERHGYRIMQEVARSTSDQVQLGPGTLYGTIKRMLADELIEESQQRPGSDLDDERRRYYKLTRLGRRVAEAEAARLAHLVRVSRQKRLIRQGA